MLIDDRLDRLTRRDQTDHGGDIHPRSRDTRLAEAAWSAEIHARLTRVDAGQATTIPWSEARQRIHAAAGSAPRN